MEKVILTNGQEFELVANGMIIDENSITFAFIPGGFTVEQLMEIWSNNETIIVKNGEVSVKKFDNFTHCKQVSIVPDYVINTKPACPACHGDIEPGTTVCPSCKVEFDVPEMIEIRGSICTVCIDIPDINDRMTDAENSIEDIVSTMLFSAAQ